MLSEGKEVSIIFIAPAYGRVRYRSSTFGPSVTEKMAKHDRMRLCCQRGEKYVLLAHLSRRLIGELLVYIEVSVVRPSVVNIFKRLLL